MKPNAITQIMDNLLVVQLTPARSCYLRLCRFVSGQNALIKVYIKDLH